MHFPVAHPLYMERAIFLDRGIWDFLKIWILLFGFSLKWSSADLSGATRTPKNFLKFILAAQRELAPI